MLHQAQIAQQHLAAVHVCGDAVTGNGLEGGRRAQRQPLFPGLAHNCLAKRVLGAALDRGRQAEDLRLAQRIRNFALKTQPLELAL